MLPSGGQRLFDNRVAWALTHLVQAGAMRRPHRGYVEITPRGALNRTGCDGGSCYLIPTSCVWSVWSA